MPSRRLPNCRTKQAFGSFATDRKLPMGALLTGGYQITHSFPFAHSSLYDGMSDAGSSLVYEQSESGTAADARRMLANEESFASAFSMSTVAGKGGGGHTSSLSSFHPPPPPPPPLAEEEKRRVVVIRDGGEKEREEGEKKDFWQKRSKQRWEERNKEVVWERHEPHLKEGGGGGGDSGGVAERREYGQSGVGEQGGEEKVKSKSRKPVTFSNAALRVAVPNEEEEEDESEAALAQRWTKAEVEIEIAKLQLLVRGGEKDVTRLKREISQRDRQQRGGVGGSERKGGTLKRGASKVKNSGSVRWSEGKNRDRGPLTKRYARVVEGNEEGEGGEGEEGEGRTTAEEWEEGIKHAGALLRIAKAELKEKHECVVKARHSKGRRILENEYVISGLIPLVGVMCDSVASLVSHKHRSPHTRRPLPPRDGREGEGGGDGDGEREQGVVDRVEAEGEEEGEEKVISKEGEEENEGKGGSGGEKDRNDNHEEKQEEGGKTGGEGEEQRRGEEERSKKKEKGTDRFAAYLDGENNERGKLLSSSGQRDYTMEEKAVIDAEALQYVIRLKTCVSTILEVLACDSESRSLLFGEDVLQNVIDALLEQVEDADMQRALLALLVQLMNHVEIEISSTIDGLFHPLFHSLLSYSEKEDIVELTVEAIWRLSSTRENALSLSTFILQLLPDQLHLISSSPPPRGALMRKSTSTSIFIPTATRTASSPSLPPHLNGGGSNGVGGLPRSPRAGGMRRGTTRGLTLSPGFLPSSPSAPSLASPSLPAGGGGGGSGSGGAKGVKGGVIINLVRVLSRHRLRLRSVRACCYCISNVIMYEATSQELLRAGRRAEIEEEVKRKERERQAETKEGVQISVIGSVEEGGEEKKQTIAAKLGVSDDVEDMKSSLGRLLLAIFRKEKLVDVCLAVLRDSLGRLRGLMPTAHLAPSHLRHPHRDGGGGGGKGGMLSAKEVEDVGDIVVSIVALLVDLANFHASFKSGLVEAGVMHVICSLADRFEHNSVLHERSLVLLQSLASVAGDNAVQVDHGLLRFLMNSLRLHSSSSTVVQRCLISIRHLSAEEMRLSNLFSIDLVRAMASAVKKHVEDVGVVGPYLGVIKSWSENDKLKAVFAPDMNFRSLLRMIRQFHGNSPSLGVMIRLLL